MKVELTEQKQKCTLGPAGPFLHRGVWEVEHSAQALSSRLPELPSSGEVSSRRSAATATAAAGSSMGDLFLRRWYTLASRLPLPTWLLWRGSTIGTSGRSGWWEIGRRERKVVAGVGSDSAGEYMGEGGDRICLDAKRFVLTRDGLLGKQVSRLCT